MDAWLCNTFGITKQQDWPIAPIMLQTDSPVKIRNSKDFWIRADPVHLRIEQNHIMLADSQAFKITMAEAKQFTEVLNQNYSKDELVFLPLRPDRWYVRTTDAPVMQTYSLNQVACKNINNFLPAGKESIAWHKAFNEIQMLLHEHPLNQAREARGELVINSVWFWGGGSIPQSAESPYTQVWSNDDLPRSLALASDAQYGKLPSDAAIWQQRATHGNHLIVLDTLYGKSIYKDAYGWRENLKKLEQNWFAPLCLALQKKNINQLTITAINENDSLNFAIKRANLWKFWLTTKPLSSYVMA